ncbi:hypothetical protein QBC39DRAFT_47878 [Podospora conica]|nr:hypothetical protein QBC39DRAFT_47878 [Schizothecium conicum]
MGYKVFNFLFHLGLGPVPFLEGNRLFPRALANKRNTLGQLMGLRQQWERQCLVSSREFRPRIPPKTVSLAIPMSSESPPHSEGLKQQKSDVAHCPKAEASYPATVLSTLAPIDGSSRHCSATTSHKEPRRFSSSVTQIAPRLMSRIKKLPHAFLGLCVCRPSNAFLYQSTNAVRISPGRHSSRGGELRIPDVFKFYVCRSTFPPWPLSLLAQATTSSAEVGRPRWSGTNRDRRQHTRQHSIFFAGSPLRCLALDSCTVFCPQL